MADPQAVEGQIVSDKDALASGKTEVELWLDKINAAKAEEKDWRESAARAAEIYEAGKDAKSNFNIYHSNVETQIPALYNSTPIPDVRRRFDPVPPDVGGISDQQMAQMIVAQAQAEAKVYNDIAELAERGLTTNVDTYDFDDVIEDMVRDAQVTGRGVPRIRYFPDAGDELRAELVPWNRFIRGPGLSWHTIPFIAYEHDLSRDQVAKLVDDADRMKALSFTKAGDDGTDFGAERDRELRHKGVLKTIKVYEVWDRMRREVVFVSPEDKNAPLATEPDPLELTGFFPSPKPMYKVRRLTSLTPVCPYDVYAPLIEQIDAISKRIRALIKQLVVKGGYDPKLAPDFELLKDADDGTYVPISASEEFVQGNGKGLEAAVMHWPIEQIVKVIQALYAEMEVVKQTIYEVMGIADIMRGSVDPREKAAQSKLKAESGSRRLQREQNEVARVSRDLFRMKAEILLTKFQPETLQEMTGMQVTPQMLEVMRNGAKLFAIDIETDSTVRADMAKYQEEMNAFLQGTAQFGQAIVGMAPVMPQMIAPLTKVYSGFARKFNLGKQGEDALEELTEAGAQPPQQPQQDLGPDPNAEAQAKQQEAEHAAMLKEQAAQLDEQRKQQQFMRDQEALDADQLRKDREHTRAMERADQAHALAMELKSVDRAIKVQDLQIKRDMADEDRMNREDEHEQDMADRQSERAERSADREDERGHKADLAKIAKTAKGKT